VPCSKFWLGLVVKIMTGRSVAFLILGRAIGYQSNLLASLSFKDGANNLAVKLRQQPGRSRPALETLFHKHPWIRDRSFARFEIFERPIQQTYCDTRRNRTPCPGKVAV
jgi:hypothetical protein